MTENMSRVLETIHQIMDKESCFEMSELVSVSGLEQVAIMQAIVLLNKNGQEILRVKGTVTPCWCDFKADWARKALARQAMSR